MGLPPRSCATDAHHCIMVEVCGPAEYKCVARVRVHRGELPSDREIRLDRTSPIQACPGEGRGLVDEDQALGVKPARVFLPLLASASDVGAILFAGVQAFF